MDNQVFSKTYLESLTNGELTKLADLNGIDIPPGLDRIFIIRELLEIEAETDSGLPADENPPPEEVAAKTDFLESAPLPKQYNITYIDILIRDPAWAFAFWEISSQDKTIHEKASDFGGYYLKLVSWDSQGGKENEENFTITVGTNDASWYLCLPSSGNCFKAALCADRGGEEAVLASSLSFRVPKFFNPLNPERQDARMNDIIRLSGIEEWNVLRNVDRVSRQYQRSEDKGQR